MGIRPSRHSKFVFLVLCAFAWAVVNESKVFGSNQFWPAAGIVWDVNGPWMLQFKETYYHFFEDSSSDHPKSDISFFYEGKNNIYDIGAGFKYIDGSQNTKQERRPYLYTIFRSKLLERDFANRFMLEYRDISESSDYWRFRYKITYNSLFESLDARGIRLLNKDKFRPYLANEVFLNSNGYGYSENRVYVGSNIKIAKDTGVNAYYLFQTKKNSDSQWQNNNIIGIEFIVKF